MSTLRARIERRLLQAILRIPPPMLAPLLARRGIYRGLDPSLALSLELLRLTKKAELQKLDLATARRQFNAMVVVGDLHPPPRVAKVEDRTIPGPAGALPIRIYRGPDTRAHLPCLLYFHGGGFCLGDLDSHDPPCRALAAEAGAAVISVEYRLAPEHRFPAAIEDALAALRYVEANAGALGVDASRLVIGGDSAGGNISAVVSGLARAGGGPQPIGQVLIYPAVDMRGGTPSRKRFASGYFLSKEMIDWFHGHYAADVLDPRASPILADAGVLARLPPSMIVTAGFDPLHDEAHTYAEKLQSAGVPVTLRDYPTMMHGFFSMGGIVEAGRAALADCAAWLRARFTG